MTDHEISVVVQGPVDWSLSLSHGLPSTYLCLRAIRKLLPNAEIILSTWPNQEFRTLEFDKVIINTDPGPQGFVKGSNHYIKNNVNRQVVSSSAGLKQVSRKFALKIRSDCILTCTNFMKIWEQHSEIGLKAPFRAFEKRVVANNLSSRNPHAKFPTFLFHPADHAHFGLTSDLLKLWDIPLQEPTEADHFLTNTRPNNSRNDQLSRLAPEQFLTLGWLTKTDSSIQMIDYADARENLKTLSDNILTSHFFILRDKDFGFSLPKYHNAHQSKYEFIRYQPKHCR